MFSCRLEKVNTISRCRSDASAGIKTARFWRRLPPNMRAMLSMLNSERLPHARRVNNTQGGGSALLNHPERHVALQRASRCGHRHCTCSGSRRDTCLDFGSRHRCERRRRSVKTNGGCSRQIVSQNKDRCSHLGRARYRFYKRPQPIVQAEHCTAARCAVAKSPAQHNCSVELPVGGLNQHSLRIGNRIEPVKHGQNTSGCDLKNRAVAGNSVPRIGPVKVSVGAARQARVRQVPIRALRLRTKVINSRQ
jgi:hypothetical protein